MKKYILCLKFCVPAGQRANYLLGLHLHIKNYFGGSYDEQEVESMLHIIDSFINGFSFKVRNTKHNGTCISRTVYNDKIDAYSLTGNRVILTISFVPENP